MLFHLLFVVFWRLFTFLVSQPLTSYHDVGITYVYARGVNRDMEIPLNQSVGCWGTAVFEGCFSSGFKSVVG